MSKKFCNAVNCKYADSFELIKFNSQYRCSCKRAPKCEYIYNSGNIRKESISMNFELTEIRSLKTLAAYLKYIK